MHVYIIDRKCDSRNSRYQDRHLVKAKENRLIQIIEHFVKDSLMPDLKLLSQGCCVIPTRGTRVTKSGPVGRPRI